MPGEGRSPVLHALRWGALLGWCGVVWFLSDQPDPGTRVGPRALALILGVPLLYGIVDEWHQSFVPGRDASLRDVVADAVGAAVGIAAHVALTRRRDS